MCVYIHMGIIHTMYHGSTHTHSLPLPRRVLFMVVSEPVDQEMECEEVGSAELDLFTVSVCTLPH